MKLLILGGTRFVGRHLTAAALAAGHRVTLFHRGVSHPELFPQAGRLLGDRDQEGGLAALAGRRWDAVIDTCGYRPEPVRASARLLAAAVEHYVFISTISVYADFTIGPGEGSPLKQPLPAGEEESEGHRYGALKVLCEQEAEAAMPGRVLQVRPGLLIGPHDPTERFAWWVRRVAAGGRILAPGPAAHPLQLLDARDLADWVLAAVERRATGPFNVTSPPGRLTLGGMLATCRAVAGSRARFTWVSEDFLAAHEPAASGELPLWQPASNHGFFLVDTGRAAAAGLEPRPLAESVRDVLAEVAAVPGAPRRLGREREAELLRAWRAAPAIPAVHP
jgi:2'-hydroxyisoflavone reductase